MAEPAALVRLERARGHDEDGVFGRPRGRLFGLNAALGPGVHAILGAPEDGSLALAELLSGRRAPLSGRVLIAGREPSRAPEVRARVGVLPSAPELPGARTVAAAVALARRMRGEPGGDAASLLAPLGLSALLERRPASLGYAEARAVELSLALTTPAPLAIVLFEPFADVALPSPAAVGARLRALAGAGACVVLITSSPADARAHADQIHVLDRGVLTRSLPGEPAVGAPGEVELVAFVHEPGPPDAGVRALATALSRSGAVRALVWEEGQVGSLSTIRVRAEDRAQAALALLEAAEAEGVLLSAVTSSVPSWLRVRGSRAGLPLPRPPAASRAAAAPAPAQALAPAAPLEAAPPGALPVSGAPLEIAPPDALPVSAAPLEAAPPGALPAPASDVPPDDASPGAPPAPALDAGETAIDTGDQRP